MRFEEPVREEFKTSTRTGRRARPQQAARPCAIVTVQRDVWTTALRLAAGDALRIEVVTEEEVVVRNRRR